MLRVGFAIALIVGAPTIARADDLASATTAAAARVRAEVEAAATVPQDEDDLAADPVLGGADPIEGDEAPGMVAFTFDDGPQAGTTEKIIKALVEYDVPAAFFIVGKSLDPKRRRKANKHAKLVQRLVSLGFQVGNHTYGHAHLGEIDKKAMAWQIDHTTEQLEKATGAAIGLFRAPYGYEGERLAEALEARGLTDVRWNLDSRDWDGLEPDEMREKAVRDIKRKNGGVILFHDTKKVTAKTIAKILDDLEAYNCKRLAAGKSIIQPVSLHYFLRDGKKKRAVPQEIEERTKRYRDGLVDRCSKRDD